MLNLLTESHFTKAVDHTVFKLGGIIVPTNCYLQTVYAVKRSDVKVKRLTYLCLPVGRFPNVRILSHIPMALITGSVLQ